MKQRERKFNQNNGEILQNPDRNINIASDMPYYGFYRYKYKNLDPLDNPQVSEWWEVQGFMEGEESA